MDDEARDLLQRAGHAFWQGGLASLPATIPLSQNGLEAAALTFVAAGLSAALSVIKGMVKARRSGSSR